MASTSGRRLGCGCRNGRAARCRPEYVASASFVFDDVVHVSALRWKAPSSSFYPVPIEGFSDSAHLSEGDPQQFYKCIIESVGHEWARRR